jgi:predicted secreted protein
MSTAYAGKGTLIKRSNGATTPVFATINGVRNIDGPGLSREYIDTTHQTSAGGYREKIPSFKDAGQVSFDLLWDPADTQHEGLISDYEDDVLRDFEKVYPNTGAATWAFSGYVTFELSAPLDDALMARVVIDISGAVERTA